MGQNVLIGKKLVDMIHDMDQLKDEINAMLKSKGLINRIDGIRNNPWEWAIKTKEGLVWFPIHRACKDVEDYIKKFDLLGGN